MLDVLLDMDSGHDDALAILTALPLVHLRAMTTVAGNRLNRKPTACPFMMSWR